MDTQKEKVHLINVQRFPRIYKVVEKVLRDVYANTGSVKTVLYQKKIHKRIFNKVYALTYSVLKHQHLLKAILKETDLLKREPRLTREAADIMIYELVYGKGCLPGESIQVRTFKKYEDEIRTAFSKCNQPDIELPVIPRYVRINTLKTSIQDVIQNFENHDFKKVEYGNIALKRYHKKVQKLQPTEFIIDYHFKDLIVFASGVNFSESELYKEGHIFLQDKSSYIPVWTLNPEPGSVVLDCCAAPGMKTAHLAALMQNKGSLYACDSSEDRFETLKSMMQLGNITICKTFCQDFKTIDPTVEPYSSVEYILLDPPCSGSGIVSRLDAVTDREDSKNEDRISTLARFQIVLLKHALSFPSLKRLVYSTCSLSEEENEYVVHEGLNHFYDLFKLSPVMPEWPVRGYQNFEHGELCLRSFPDKNLTNGFFVAMFERIEYPQTGMR